MIEAKTASRTIWLHYRDARGNLTWRLVDPDGVEGVVLAAWCLHREETRRFALARMIEMRLGPSDHEVFLPLGPPEERPPGWE